MGGPSLRTNTLERRALVVQGRIEHQTFPEIAKKLGVTSQRAQAIYKSARETLPQEQLETFKWEQILWSEDAMKELRKLATSRGMVSPRTRIEAWNSLLKYMEHTSKLFGLYPTPEKQNITLVNSNTTNVVLNSDVADSLNRVKARSTRVIELNQ